MRGFMARLRFWLHKPPFLYRKQTGDGYAIERYNPFTDVVIVRRSRFGEVVGWHACARQQYMQQHEMMQQENNK